MKYFDFDIRISALRPGCFAVQAESEHHGEVSAEIYLDPEAADFKSLMSRLASRQTDRASLIEAGRELYRQLFVQGIETIFQRSYGEVVGTAGLGLRLRLRITAPSLAVLPWELLYAELDHEFIATRTTTPLVRYLELPGYRRRLATTLPLRILVVIPRGGDPARALDSASEKAVIEQALEGMADSVEVCYLHERHADQRVTWQRLYEQLVEQDFHCVHFIGHGTFADECGYLVLDAPEAGDEPVPDERFAELFRNASMVKLVVLNACKGAALSASRALAGSAAQLVQHGVPAVVAMQFSVYDEAAVKFARSFYHSLFQSSERGRVDVAVSRGRQVLGVDYPDQREVAAPVLFMHTANGMLFVPETGQLLRDLPRNRSAIDTLQAAREATDSVVEAARFQRRINLVKRSVQIGLLVATLLFCMASIRLLDIFTIDTRIEFLVMSLGNDLAEHTLSEDLRIVTVDGSGLTVPETRAALGEVITTLAGAGARVVALDVFFPAENAEFKTDPASGRRLVELIRRADTAVVVGSQALSEQDFQVPRELRQVVAGIGHLCYESKLGLTRSLPLTVNNGNRDLASLALAAFVAATQGTLLPGEKGEDGVTVIYPDRPSQRLAVSERNSARRKVKTCGLIQPGDEVSHRFVRLSGAEQLARVTTTATALRQADDASLGERFADKLVLVGILGVGDTVPDLTGERDGVLWQADAINNLMLDAAIRPIGMWPQLILMLAVAALGASLRLHSGAHQARGRWILLLLSTALMLAAVYAYGRYNILLNPVYDILALWFAWWLAGKAGTTWLARLN